MTKVSIPAPDADGIYRFPDGSYIRPTKWVAHRKDGLPVSYPQPEGFDAIVEFNSPDDAAAILSACGEAR